MDNQTNKLPLTLIRFFTALLIIGLYLPSNSARAAPSMQGEDFPSPTSRTASTFWGQIAAPIENQKTWETTTPVEATNLIQDPGFENSNPPADNPYWVESDSVYGTPLCNGSWCGYWTDAHPYNGSAWAWFGAAQEPVHTASLSQTVTFPTGGATLRFYFWIGYAQPGSNASDAFFAKIDGVTVFTANATQIGTYSNYTLISIDVSAFANGAPHTIQFSHINTYQDVGFQLDDVALFATRTISGHVGVVGATLNYTGGSTTSDGSGNYTISVPYGWSGTVTPSKTGYTFLPASRTYSNVTSNKTAQNYVPQVTISGNAGVAGAALNYTGGSTTGDGSGNYTISVPYGWSGTVTPSKSCYTFSPVNRTYSNVTMNQTAQNYTATYHSTLNITGNTGVAAVTLSYDNGGPQTVNSDNNGDYTITVPCGWSGTVTPSRTGFTFVPVSKTYSNLGADQSNQNYAASWVGGVLIEADQSVVAVGRPHVGAEVMTYNGFSSGSLNAYVPMLFKDAFGGSYDSALYVQNLDTTNTANVTIHFYDNTGAETCSQGDTIAPLASKGYWLPSIACLGSSWVGGVKVEADQNIVAVGRPHVGSEVLTYTGFSSGDLNAYVPMLFKDAFGGSYDSALYVQNVDPGNTANITIRFYDNTGAETCSQGDTIAPLASKGYWLPGIACLGTSWVGGVKVESDQNIVAVGRPHVGSQVLAYNGFTAGSLDAYVSMLFNGAFGGSYNAAFYVQNVDSGNTANITVKYYDSAGNLNCTKADTIAPLASKGYWVPSATCDSGSLPAGWVGGVKVESDQNIVAVGRPHVGSQVMAYDSFAVGSLNAYVPMLFRDAFGGSYDSALYVQNVDPGNTANITIKLYDNTGNLACTLTDTLSALASKGYWLPALKCVP